MAHRSDDERTEAAWSIDPVVESTNPSTAARSRWTRLRASKSADQDVAWAFSDGSSSGRFGAVLVHRGGQVIQRLTGKAPMTSTRNVGAELNAALLALEHAPRGERLNLVFDYLGVGAWITGNWQIKDDEVRAKVQRALGLIQGRGLKILCIHHPGHQRDSSDFTRYNAEADALCSGKPLEPSRSEETGHGEEPDVAPLRPRPRRVSRRPR